MLIDSIFPGSVYENTNNEKVRYDPQKAVQLLAEAGWKDRDAQGRLVKNGQPLAIEIVYANKRQSATSRSYQEDLRKVGITPQPSALDVRNDRQAARRPDVRHGVDRLHRAPLSESRSELAVAGWPTRRTRTTSRASRTSASTRSSTLTTRNSISTSASSSCAKFDGILHQRAPLHP